MNDIISVVIPVYNVEKYLGECIESVINQTYSNLQIILIDDGSTDSSGIICDQYSDKDKRITVVHQENAGAGAAKNRGLDLVKGKYFSIIDSDDYIELNMYEKMLDYINKFKVDIVQCLFKNVYVNDSIDSNYAIVHNYPVFYNSQKFLTELLYDWKYAIFANKIFKTELLKEIRFPVGRKIDDEFFTYKLVCNANKILNISDVLYNYRMRQSSVMNENSELFLVKDRVECFIERYYYVASIYPKLKNIYYDKLADLLLYYRNVYGKNDFIENAIESFPAKHIFLLSNIKERFRAQKYRSISCDNDTEKEYFI